MDFTWNETIFDFFRTIANIFGNTLRKVKILFVNFQMMISSKLSIVEDLKRVQSVDAIEIDEVIIDNQNYEVFYSLIIANGVHLKRLEDIEECYKNSAKISCDRIDDILSSCAKLEYLAIPNDGGINKVGMKMLKRSILM
jgi:hypothetical protein